MGPHADEACWVTLFTHDCTGQMSYDRPLSSVSVDSLGLNGPCRKWNCSWRDYWRAGNKPTHHRVAGKGWASCNKKKPTYFYLEDKVLYIEHFTAEYNHTFEMERCKWWVVYTVTGVCWTGVAQLNNWSKTCPQYWSEKNAIKRATPKCMLTF